jgi:hypothetical protein
VRGDLVYGDLDISGIFIRQTDPAVLSIEELSLIYIPARRKWDPTHRGPALPAVGGLRNAVATNQDPQIRMDEVK